MSAPNSNERIETKIAGSTAHRMARTFFASLFVFALVVVPMSTTSAAKDKHGVKRGALRVDSVVRNPEPFYGLKISVKGDIDDIYGPGAFTIERSNPSLNELSRATDKELLVIVPIGLRSTIPSSEIEKGQDVELVGVLHRGVTSDMDDFNNLDADDADFDDEPVLIVEEIVFD
jgi:hypothetical protein